MAIMSDELKISH